MTAEQFAYWLQGFAELQEQAPDAEQWRMIREHLALVFKKVTSAPHWMDGPIVTPPLSPTSAPFDFDMTPRVTCALPGHISARAVC